MEKQEFFSGAFNASRLGFADIDEILDLACDEDKLGYLPSYLANLISADLSAIKSNAIPLYSKDEALEIYESIYSLAISLTGAVAKRLPLFIVDALPSPFDNRPWKAMCVDHCLGSFSELDEGIYFKKEFLARGMLEVMLAHEIVHYIISSFSHAHPQPYTSLLEEGACDFLSYYILLSSRPELEGAIRVNMLQNRFGATKKTIGRARYYQLSKAIFAHALKNGVSGVLDLLKQGRGEWSLEGSQPLEISTSDKALLTLASIYFELDSSVVLPIDEYAILALTAEREKASVLEIATTLGVSCDIIISKVEKMQGEGLLAIEGDTVFNYNKKILNKFYYSI